MRLDQYLSTSLGSRTRASDAIKAKRVSVNGKIITKPAFLVEESDKVEVTPIEHDYVSRAGGKLLAAIEHFQIDLNNQCVLDIGASTGGFTQCSLEHGARKVYALDVGHLQLSALLDQDKRVVKMEKMNAKDIKKDWFDEPIDFICMDTSHISALHILRPVLKEFVPNHLVVLVKPQFECGPKAINKKGVIRHPKYQKEALDRVLDFLQHYYSNTKWIASPILGRQGNQEYLVYATKRRTLVD